MTWERLLSGNEIRARMEITEEEALEAVKLVKPLVRNHDTNLLHEIETPNLFNIAFKWDPKFKEPVDANKLQLLSCWTTYHTCAYHGIFKPTISEVLAQIPAEVRGEVDYFELLFSDEITQIIDRDGFYGHKTVTLFYKKL